MTTEQLRAEFEEWRDALITVDKFGAYYLLHNQRALRDAFQAAATPRESCIAQLTQQLAEKEAQCAEITMSHDAIAKMISRYLVACKGHVSDSWMDAFIECGAITYDASYPTGFIAPKPISTTAGQTLLANIKAMQTQFIQLANAAACVIGDGSPSSLALLKAELRRSQEILKEAGL